MEVAGWLIYMEVDSRLMVGHWWRGDDHVPGVRGGAGIFREGGGGEREGSMMSAWHFVCQGIRMAGTGCLQASKEALELVERGVCSAFQTGWPSDLCWLFLLPVAAFSAWLTPAGPSRMRSLLSRIFLECCGLCLPLT